MVSVKQARRETVRQLKSITSTCFVSMVHFKLPHCGCPSQYDHAARMPGSPIPGVPAGWLIASIPRG